MISISNHVIAASLELPINIEVGHYSPHLISVRFGAADNTLTIDNAKMDVRCGYYRAAELTEFPFCYPGTWTPRPETSEVYDEPAVEEWEPTNDYH